LPGSWNSPIEIISTIELIGKRTNDEVDCSIVSPTRGLKFLLGVPEGFRDVQIVEVNCSLLATLGATKVEHDLGILDRW
jgi:hypothetical protein